NGCATVRGHCVWAIQNSSCACRCSALRPIAMHAVYEPPLWITQETSRANPDFHHGLLGFKADRPRKVLYLDGELPLSQLQERVRDMVALENRRNVQLFNPEMLPTPRGIDLLHGGDFAAL